MGAHFAGPVEVTCETEPVRAAIDDAKRVVDAARAMSIGADALIPQAALEAMALEFRQELARMAMQLVLYRAALEEAGIEPPDREGAELLDLFRDCYGVVTSASQFFERLGPAKEMLARFR